MSEPRDADEAEYYAALEAYRLAVDRLSAAKKRVPGMLKENALKRRRHGQAKRKALEAVAERRRPRGPDDFPAWLDECSPHLAGRLRSYFHHQMPRQDRGDLTLPYVRAKGRDYWVEQFGFGPKIMSELDGVVGGWP